MTPPTWGRTSAMRRAEVRPDSSVVSATRWGSTTNTPTSGGPLGGGLAAVFFPHPVIIRPTTRTPTVAISLALFVVCIDTSIICGNCRPGGRTSLAELKPASFGLLTLFAHQGEYGRQCPDLPHDYDKNGHLRHPLQWIRLQVTAGNGQGNEHSLPNNEQKYSASDG